MGQRVREEIEAAAKTYSVQWTYDDQRLPKSIKDILARVLAGDYDRARSLREDLAQSFQQLSELSQQEGATDLSVAALD